MHKMQEIQMSNKRKINDFDAQNVGNTNVQKRQINDFGAQNVGNRNVQQTTDK